MKNSELFSEDHSATYCPEDDKLRLYVGRVSREEYDALRAEGWQALHKQRETGGGDFAAVWTSEREDTALSYAGVILDEDMGPAERAADRAERFSGYLDKRLTEATAHADRYDSGPAVHGYQDKGRAVRATDRHDRIADRAVNAWDKAEYWQSRTAGVISHALHVSSPSVRMGRIKTIEAELRKAEKTLEQHREHWRMVSAIAADIPGTVSRTAAQGYYAGDVTKATIAVIETVIGYGKTRNPRAPELPEAYLFEWMGEQTPEELRPTAQEFIDRWLARNPEPKAPGEGESGNARFIRHCRLRLAYENQMIEAQGGRAAGLEIVPGGLWGGRLIVKVNKSPATGRVTSVSIKGPRVEGYQYKTESPKGASYSLHQFDTERAAPGTYTPPTPESLAELAALKEEGKAKRKAAKEAGQGPAPLVNPTPEDAERLQALLNAKQKVPDWKKDHKPSTVATITQARYSELSKGGYSPCETIELCGNGEMKSGGYRDAARVHNLRVGPAVVKVRVARGDEYCARRVVVLSDKPQKALPAALWIAHRTEHTMESMIPHAAEIRAAVQGGWRAIQEAESLMARAEVAGILVQGSNQAIRWTEAGAAWMNQHAAPENGKFVAAI